MTGRRKPRVPMRITTLLGAGDLLVAITESGLRFVHHMAAPFFHAQLLQQSDYRIEMGEVFPASDGLCLVNVQWPEGEPHDRDVLGLMSDVGSRLADLQSWVPVEVPTGLESAQAAQMHPSR